MSQPEPSGSTESLVTSFLVAWDELLAAGIDPGDEAAADLPPELRARLAGGLASVRRLRAVAPPAAPTHLGRLVIERELGRGGFGTVYLAHDPQLKRTVALKVPRADALLDQTAGERLRHEARAVALLDHPNIVPVYESGNVGPVWYVASAYCPGVTLAEWVRTHPRPVRWADAARTVAAVADAVAHAHARGILHRDLKPANILLTGDTPPTGGAAWGDRELEAFTPRVTDFGLSKVMTAADGATRSGAVLGTPSYMAPEQAEGRVRDVTAATDVYGLGTVLYELLTGRPPFPAAEPLAALRAASATDPAPPRSVRPAVPRDLELVCLKCLRKDPARRYPSATELAADLRRFAGGEPVLARRAGRVERAARWVRRNPAAAALLALAVTVPTAAAAGVWWHNRKLTAALQTAERYRADAEGSRETMADAVDDFLLDASVLLQELPQSEGKQRVLLEKALRVCEKLEHEHGGDPTVRQRALKAAAYVAEIRSRLGDTAGSDAAAERAEGLARRLAADYAHLPDARQKLASVLLTRGRLLAMRRENPRADPFLREAEALFAQVCNENPDDVTACRSWATAAEWLANAERLDPKTPLEAIAERYRLALRLREAVARKTPADPDAVFEVATALQNLAGPAEGGGRIADAVALYRRAAEQLAPLVEAHPTRRQYRKVLAFVLTQRGRLVGEVLRRGREGEAVLEQGIAHWARLRGDHPKVPDYDIEFAKALLALADSRTAGRNFDAAQNAVAEAADVTERLVRSAPDSVYFLRLKLRCLCSLGAVQTRKEELEPASKTLAAAGELAERCLAGLPHDRSLLIRRDELRIRSGEVAARSGNAAVARRHFADAQQSLTALASRYPTTPEFRQLLNTSEARLRDSETRLPQ